MSEIKHSDFKKNFCIVAVVHAVIFSAFLGHFPQNKKVSGSGKMSTVRYCGVTPWQEAALEQKEAAKKVILKIKDKVARKYEGIRITFEAVLSTYKDKIFPPGNIAQKVDEVFAEKHELNYFRTAPESVHEAQVEAPLTDADFVRPSKNTSPSGKKVQGKLATSK